MGSQITQIEQLLNLKFKDHRSICVYQFHLLQNVQQSLEVSDYMFFASRLRCHGLDRKEGQFQENLESYLDDHKLPST